MCCFLSIFLTASPVHITYEKKIPSHTHQLIEENFHFSMHTFSNLVYRRFYFINRLTEIINLFRTIEKKSDKFKLEKEKFCCSLSCDDFTINHELISSSMNQIKRVKNLHPLFLVWNDFIHYKSLHDQLLVDDFTKQVFIVSRSLLQEKNYSITKDQYINASTEDLLDLIDIYVDSFKNKYNLGTIKSKQTKMRVADLKPHANINEVINRFYCIKRLNKVWNYLNYLNFSQKDILFEYTTLHNQLELNKKYIFSNETVISCIKIMQQTNSISPLIELSANINEYKDLHEITFIKEYLILLYTTISSINTNNDLHITTKKNDLLSVDDVDLEKILNAIDMIAQELPPLLEKFEFNSDMPWNKWLKKYWWAPVTITIVMTIKMYLILKK